MDIPGRFASTRTAHPRVALVYIINQPTLELLLSISSISPPSSCSCLYHQSAPPSSCSCLYRQSAPPSSCSCLYHQFNDFVDIDKWHLNAIVSIRNVSMRERDPSYVKPYIKLLLRKNNKLMRAGKMEHSDCIAVKINRLIAYNRSSA